MTAVHPFCAHVLAGTAAAELPAGDAARGEALRLLRAHRLLGLWMEESGGGDGGGPWVEEARAVVAFQALQGGLTLEASDRARSVLRDAGFDVLLIKGAGLIEAGLYSGARARALGDADLLVRGGGARDAVHLLEEAGFEPWVPWAPGRPAWLPAFTLSDGRAPAGIDVTVDLHWRVPYGSYRSGGEADDSGLWEGADLAGGIPSPEVHALLVAEHFVRHLRVVPHLVGMADLVRLLPLIGDPVRLRELARARGALRLLRSLLWFVETELGVELARDVREAVGVPDGVGRARARVLRLEALLAVPEGRRQERIPGVLSQAALQGTPLDFLRELAHVAYPPSEWLDRRAGSGSGGRVRRRLGYWWELVRWAVGRGASPLSPNQELEGPEGADRHPGGRRD